MTPLLRRLKDFPFVDLKGIANAVILCHRNADVDAYCSAYAIASLLKQIRPKLKIAIASPGGLDSLAKKVKERFEAEVVELPNIQDADLAVVVDTGDLSLLEEWSEHLRHKHLVKVLIDHHPWEESAIALMDFPIIDTESSSSCEIVYRICRAKGVRLGQDVYQVLLTGILYDSQHLTIANSRAIGVVSELCRKGASLEVSRDLLRAEKNVPETMARLKAAKRMKVYRAGEWLITMTTIGSFHASAARALLAIGADMAFALGVRDDGVRCSMRSTQNFYAKTGIHLGTDIARRVASVLKGRGGGHPTASSFSSPTSIGETITALLDVLSERLQTEIKEISS